MTGNTPAGIVYIVLAAIFGVGVYAVFKKVSPGDGVFFCSCMSLGIMIVGVVVNFTLAQADYPNFSIHDPPAFEPYTMWGGVAWQLGNLLCPMVVRLLGVGVGVGVWETMDLLTGWATSKFGLFGVKRNDVSSPVMNYVGVALACLSVLVMIMVEQEAEPELGSDADCKDACKDDASKPQEDCEDDAAGPEPGGEHDVEAQAAPGTPATSSASTSTSASASASSSPRTALRRCRRHGAKAGGVLLAMLVGLLQGLKLDSSVYLMQMGELGQGHSTNPMHYIFPLYSSICLTSAVVLAVYVARNGRESYLALDLVLPGLLGGVLWGISIVLTFYANEELRLVLSYPAEATLIGIMTTGMAFYYGEFPTRRSCVLAAAGTLIRILAVTLIALSDTVGGVEEELIAVSVP